MSDETVIDDAVVVQSSDSKPIAGARKSHRIPVPRRRNPEFNYVYEPRQRSGDRKEKAMTRSLGYSNVRIDADAVEQRQQRVNYIRDVW